MAYDKELDNMEEEDNFDTLDTPPTPPTPPTPEVKPITAMTNEELGAKLRQQLAEKLAGDKSQIEEVNKIDRPLYAQLAGGFANMGEGMLGKNITDFSGKFNEAKAQKIKNILDARKVDDDTAAMYQKLLTAEMAPKILQAKIDIAKANAAEKAKENEWRHGITEENQNIKKQMIEDNKIKAQVAKAEKEAKASELNAVQAKAAGYAKRLEQAEEVFDKVREKGYKKEDLSSSLARKALPRAAWSPEAQQQEQAELNFVNAVLRPESGAAISTSEFTNAEKQYFPQFGDSEEVIAQKKNNRLQKLEALKSEAGKNYDKMKFVGQQKQLSDEDNKALAWAKANPNDARSAAILKKLGV